MAASGSTNHEHENNPTATVASWSRAKHAGEYASDLFERKPFFAASASSRSADVISPSSPFFRLSRRYRLRTASSVRPGRTAAIADHFIPVVCTVRRIVSSS